MSEQIKTAGFYYPIPKIKTDEEALNYFKQFFPKEFEAKFEEYSLHNYSPSAWEIIMETRETLNSDWLPFCDIKGNWAWVNYSDETDLIQISILTINNAQDSLTMFLNKDHQHEVYWVYDQNIKFFFVDWYTGGDFPLIIK